MEIDEEIGSISVDNINNNLRDDFNFYKNENMAKEKWYKRVFKRILKWFKSKSHKRTSSNNYNNNYNYNDKYKFSAEDIPRMSLNIENNEIVDNNKLDQTIIKKDVSPMINEPWKEDAQLMMNGKYFRFKMMSNFVNKYRLISIIGQGSFGFVLKAERVKDSLKVAVKFIYKLNINANNWTFDSELGLIPTEVFYLKTLNHRGIVQFLDYFEEDRYVYLVTELHGINWGEMGRNSGLNDKSNPGLKMKMIEKTKMANESINTTMNTKNNTTSDDDPQNNTSPCDLFECIEAHYYLPESTIHLIFTQLLEISAYLTTQGLVHRDLKDENVVVDAGYRIKIVDFGCASRIPYSNSEEGYFEKFNGTLAFAPPEVIRGLKYKGSEAETWTLGVLLYTMAFRQAPFQDSQAILYGQLDFPFYEDEPGKIIIWIIW